MKVHRAIVHRIFKEVNEVPRFNGSSTCLECADPLVIDLVDQLNSNFQERASFSYAVFQEGEPVFKREFTAYMQKPADDVFVSFTRNSSLDLKRDMVNQGAARGGYIVYSHYNKNGHEFMGVFLVRNTKGVSFRKPPGASAYQLKQKVHIDMSKIAMVCRINLAVLNAQSGNYLSFSNNRNDVSQYFLSWIAADNKDTNEIETKNLMKLLGELDLPDGFSSKLEVYKAVGQMVEKVKQQINVRDISRELFGDENKILNESIAREIPISTEFKIHKSTMKRYLRVTARAEEIELTFPRAMYENNKIRFSNTDRDLIMISSKALAEKIRKELEHE
jgi:nucleoid-associated protein